MPAPAGTGEKVYRGIPVSGGVCRGPVHVLARADSSVPRRAIRPDEVCSELERLQHALILTRQQLLQVQRQVEEAMGAADASIFDAHLLVLEKPSEVAQLVKEFAG